MFETSLDWRDFPSRMIVHSWVRFFS